MMIGTFFSTHDGYTGRLRTLLIDADISIVAAQHSDAENAPDWRILCGDSDTGAEIGAGWNRTGERAGAYIAVQIDDPMLPVALRANLLRSVQNPDSYHLLWSRPAAGGRK